MSVRQSGPSRAARYVRLRGDRSLAQLFRAPTSTEPARLFLASRDEVAEGEAILVEIGLGAMADEVVLSGVVARAVPRHDHLTDVEIEIDRSDSLRVDYVLDVLGGRRQATARGSRRLRCDLPVHWSTNGRAQATRLHDLSRGGAFILSSEPPPVGTTVDVVLSDRVGPPLRFESTVSWVRERGERAGFGVAFRVPDRNAASMLHSLVRTQEAATASGPS